MALNVGLIGCGNVVSYGHRPALTTLPDVELVALADVTEARRKIGQDWFSLPENALYADYHDLLARKDVQAVCITVPQGFRREIVLNALAAGKHVLAEKPIATTPAIADELVRAADKADLIFGMVHNYVYLPEYKLMKQLIGAGNIGQLRVAMMHFLGVIDNPGAAEYQSDWRHHMAAGGGVLMDMIHAVYLAEWLFGESANQVMAFVDALEYRDRKPEVEDTALLQIAFPSGYGAIHMGWGEGVGGVDLSGSDGQIRMRYQQDQTSGFSRPQELYSVDKHWERQDYVLDNMPTHMDNIARSFTQLWEDFRDAIEEKRDPVMPARAGKRALEIALGAYLSGLTGRVVTLPLDTDSPVYHKGIAGLAEVEAWGGSRTKAAGLFGVK
ncbi:MAG: Gfo/Idh/MocA family oxidoreductase [Burkholderiales bacterium]|nr:Gfo/Idh/MocA family oxidoreductase [Anaerolineae bacterium]